MHQVYQVGLYLDTMLRHFLWVIFVAIFGSTWRRIMSVGLLLGGGKWYWIQLYPWTRILRIYWGSFMYSTGRERTLLWQGGASVISISFLIHSYPSRHFFHSFITLLLPFSPLFLGTDISQSSPLCNLLYSYVISSCPNSVFNSVFSTSSKSIFPSQ